MKRLILLLVSLLSFSPNTFAYDFEIPPPPVKGSLVDREDYEALHRYQESRTQKECAIADAQSAPNTKNFFGPQTGILTTAELKQVESSMNQLMHKIFNIVDPMKEHYNRARPYNTDYSLHPCIRKPGGSKAYPSAHATAGIVISLVLAKQFPAKRDLILQQGLQIGENRVIGGVHHPSDVKAGQDLGREIVNHLSEL